MEQATEQIEGTTRKNNQAFRVVEVNVETGETLIALQRGILRSASNQLKSTDSHRKCSSILRKLGYVLAECGNLQYGGEIKEMDIDPSLVTDNVEQ